MMYCFYHPSMARMPLLVLCCENSKVYRCFKAFKEANGYVIPISPIKSRLEALHLGRQPS